MQTLFQLLPWMSVEINTCRNVQFPHYKFSDLREQKCTWGLTHSAFHYIFLFLPSSSYKVIRKIGFHALFWPGFLPEDILFPIKSVLILYQHLHQTTLQDIQYTWTCTRSLVSTKVFYKQNVNEQIPKVIKNQAPYLLHEAPLTNKHLCCIN